MKVRITTDQIFGLLNALEHTEYAIMDSDLVFVIIRGEKIISAELDTETSKWKLITGRVVPLVSTKKFGG